MSASDKKQNTKECMQLEERATATASLIVREPGLLPVERFTHEHVNGCFGFDVEVHSSGHTQYASKKCLPTSRLGKRGDVHHEASYADATIVSRRPVRE